MSRPRPTDAQLQATDPARSNWVTANAGSGKTHVLTQRVARLLLEDVPPHKILCLTYTKAAASEMQTRLFRLLGDWAMASQADLAEELANLTGRDRPVENAVALARARRLFARALETPGGLKIQTIHAFCDSLLRRFPLEAGISPRFEVADERQASDMLAGIRADMGDAAEQGTDDGLDLVAALLNEDGIDQLASAVMGQRDALGDVDLEDRLLAHFGDAARQSEAEIAAAALNRLNRGEMSLLAEVMTSYGGKTEQRLAGMIHDWLSDEAPDPQAHLSNLSGLLVKQDGTERKQGLATKSAVAARPQLAEEIPRLAAWAVDTRNDLLSSRMAARTRTLHRFARGLLGRHEDAKAFSGLLDFNDLIARVRGMLVQSAMRSWVLYKLDRGIDHILVDEAQDTSPLQWEVIRAISDEFLSGEGASTAGRSLFVVGDEKQSIYSFQGAEPQAFGHMRESFRRRFEDLRDTLGRPQLTTSFRSAPAILDFVDRVFAGEASEGLTVDNDPVEHRAHREGARGRVDLWPLIEPPERPREPDWWEPVDMVPEADAKEQLARLLTGRIRDMIGVETLPERGDRPARRVKAGDILVLVSKRDRLARGIIRELKGLGVPVAGADRLALTSELAVKDLLALARVAVMPEDDLTTAALLRSPLFGLSEEDLRAIAQARRGSLRQAMRRSKRLGGIAGALDGMTMEADFRRPYEFFENALIRWGGRKKLIARLGPEAEDAIDEFLTQALAYEAVHIPTLTGFISWLDAANITVKREMDSGSDEVRVMTVHGAKGLEAPIVILPDTMSGKGGGGQRPRLIPATTQGNRPDLTLWLASKDQDDPVLRSAREIADRRERDERRRLLYVALTRAEDWLILCGANARTRVSDSWYEMLAHGMQTSPEAEVQHLPSPTGEGEMLRYQTGAEPGEIATPAGEPDAGAVDDLPVWAGPAPREIRTERQRPSDLSPSRALLGDDGSDHQTHGGIGLGRDLAMRRGTAVHLLLEHVTDGEPMVDPVLADRLLEEVLPDATPDLLAGIHAEVGKVLAMPEALDVFGADAIAEVSLAIDKPKVSRDRIIGRVDRLVLSNQRALVVDFKTDGRPPATQSGVPAKYLIQMGAYLSAVRKSWPGHRAEAAILWTRSATLMPVDAEHALHAYETADWTLRQA
ncbi:MAG: double-strand break repair helicase AddA [Pseudomonadota bacterium]